VCRWYQLIDKLFTTLNAGVAGREEGPTWRRPPVISGAARLFVEDPRVAGGVLTAANPGPALPTAHRRICLLLLGKFGDVLGMLLLAGCL
jgi:hypothetical protein